MGVLRFSGSLRLLELSNHRMAYFGSMKLKYQKHIPYIIMQDATQAR
jgi:hypothetical protein